MAACDVASIICQTPSHGIYDTHIKIRGAPFLEESDLVGPAHDKLKVNEIMADRLVTLQPAGTSTRPLLSSTEAVLGSEHFVSNMRRVMAH
jgi:hypothetical protein